MISSEFVFEEQGWEAAIEALPENSNMDAVQLLTLMEGESEETFEEALQLMMDRHIMPDLTNLPRPSGDDEAAVRLRREEQLVKEGKLLENLEENDPLGLYLQELASIPVCGDVNLLAERLAQGDRTVTKQLTDLMLSRVVEEACNHTGRGVLLLDLIQEGSIGLWQGILNYTGGDIESHCHWHIRWDIARAVLTCAREKGVGQKLRRAMEDYRCVDERLLTQLGRTPTMEEMAEALHMSVDEASRVAKTIEAARLVARVKQPEQDEAEPEEDQAVEDTAYFQMRQRIEELMSVLSPQEAQLLTLRFGLEGGKPLTAQQIGERMNMTPEEAVAMEAAVLSKLRNQ